MEVILKTKIDTLGAEADIVSVRPGYAQNYLIPQNLAALATSATKHQVQQLQKRRAEREAQELNDAQEVARRINKLSFKFTLISGEGQQKVFGSVTAQDVRDRLKKEGVEIDRKKVKLDKAIKETGKHEVLIALHSDVQAKLKITINAASQDEKKEQNSSRKSSEK